MQMVIEKPNRRLHLHVVDFKECSIANVFSGLVVHIESTCKMIIFTSGLLQGFRLLFQVHFAYNYAFVWKMAVLL